MVRIANGNDAEQLRRLNEEFNGEETTIESIKESLRNNPQEVVIVAEEDHTLVGFVCVQLKKSFCYDNYRLRKCMSCRSIEKEGLQAI